jgi:hypothetical protein
MVLVQNGGRTPQDPSRVSLEEEWEVTYWCERYSVNGEELRACVAKVGPLAQDVERYLRETGGGKKIFSNTGED